MGFVLHDDDDSLCKWIIIEQNMNKLAPEQKSKHWKKPDSELLFHFVDMLET